MLTGQIVFIRYINTGRVKAPYVGKDYGHPHNRFKTCSENIIISIEDKNE